MSPVGKVTIALAALGAVLLFGVIRNRVFLRHFLGNHPRLARVSHLRRRPMTRRPREDEAGSWHHVTNRGIAKRALYEGRRDMRCFLACLSEAIRVGLI